MKQKYSMLRFLSCFLVTVLFPVLIQAQTKSTNIQTINGKKYYLHKMEKGQSLYSLTKLYGVDLNSIYAENPQAKTGTKAGEEIKIPFVNASSSVTTTTISTPTVLATSSVSAQSQPIDTNRYKTYKVAKGETLYSITKKINLSDKELEKWNPSISQGIKEGQLLIIGEKRKTGNSIATPVSVTTPTYNPDSINPHVIHAKKQSYNVGLFLPFRTDLSLATDINYLAQKKLNFPSMSSLAIDFYLGFKKAVDSATVKDMEVNLSLFDVDDKDSGKIESIVKSAEFKQLDMIVGPLYATGFKTVAQAAREMNVPAVSPYTQQTKILYNNPWTSKMTPSQYTLLEGLADYCMDSLKGQVMLVSNTKDVKETTFNKAFKSYYNERLKKMGRPVADTVFEVKGIAGVKAANRGVGKVIVVTLSANQVFIVDFVTQLAIYAGKKDMVLAGWQSTSNLDNLDQEYLNQLKYTFPSENNLTNTLPYDAHIKDYKALMNTYPSEYFFEGYDLGTFYLKQLKEKGIDGLLELDKAALELPYVKFKFARPDRSTGFDNRGMYIFKYDNYKLVKTGWN